MFSKIAKWQVVPEKPPEIACATAKEKDNLIPNFDTEFSVREYLLDVLPGMADRKRSEVAELTPTRWKAAKQ